MTSRYWICLVAGLASLLLCNSLHAQTDAFDTTQDESTQNGLSPDDETGAEDLASRGPQQTVTVREDRAGWQAAGIGLSEGRLSEKLRSNWVMVDANGLLRGTVIGFNSEPVADVFVKLLENGQVVNSTRVNAQGQFSFNNVQQGTYGLVGFGPDSFFAFGFDAIRNSSNPKADAPRSITVMATPNKTNINTDWINYFGPDVKYRVYGRFESREGTEDPQSLYGTDGISTHYPDAFPSTSIQSHAVTALSDGRLIGRVHQIDSLNGRPVDVRNTRVILLKDNDVYAATSSDNFGVFSFTRIEPGFYSLVAAGVDGLAAIGLEVVDASGVDPTAPLEDEGGAQAEDDEIVPIDIALLPSESSGWLVSYANEEAYQRVLMATARLNAQRAQCNCPPTSQAQYDALARALTPNKRGAFWERMNSYFDELFYGPDASQGNAPAQGQYGPNGYSSNYAPTAYQPQGYPTPMMQRSGPMNQRPISNMPPGVGNQPTTPRMAPADINVSPVPALSLPGETVPGGETVPRSGGDTSSYRGFQYQNSGYQVPSVPNQYQYQQQSVGNGVNYRLGDR